MQFDDDEYQPNVLKTDTIHSFLYRNKQFINAVFASSLHFKLFISLFTSFYALCHSPNAKDQIKEDEKNEEKKTHTQNHYKIK